MWIIFSLLAAVCAATVVILSKIGIKDVDSSLAFAVQSVLILIVAWSTVVWKGQLSEVTNIDRRSLLFLVAAGVITCASSLLSFQALKIGEASRTSSFDKVSLVFSVLLAVFFLKEKVTWQLVVGVLLMGSGAIFIAFSQNPSK